MKTKSVLAVFLGVFTLAWAWDAFYVNPMANGALPWVIRQQGLNMTGLWSIALMSLVMVLATRPAWSENLLDGMDKTYRLHKWAGILAVVFGVAHWLFKLASGPLKSWVGTLNRPARAAMLPMAENARSIAKDMGEWTIYLLLIMLVVTLWKRFPYRSWRLVHRIMPVAYLVLVFHTVVLTPASYWTQPVGLLLAGVMLLGTLACLTTFGAAIGKKRQAHGKILSVSEKASGITEVVCEMGPSWPGHQAGQFAFATFAKQEGAHPFTIASASETSPSRVVFQIKALGDYTKGLGTKLEVGQSVMIEGPYGRFTLDHASSGSPQLWVAGGIGITPFLSWLESLQHHPETAPHAQLHYCVRDAATDPFVTQLQNLCRPLKTLSLHVHSASDGSSLTVEHLISQHTCHDEPLSIWFCGPAGLAKKLKTELKSIGAQDMRFHQEAFEMR